MDAVLAAQLEAIANGLEQITNISVELQELRTIVEELVQTVAALVANSAVSESDLEQLAPAATDEVLIVQTYDIPADDEAVELREATPPPLEMYDPADRDGDEDEAIEPSKPTPDEWR
jgi:hypothetical protein